MPFLHEIHPHPLDNQVVFFEAGHRYEHVESGKRVRTSVTSLLKPYFDTFDGSAIVKRQFNKWILDDNGKYGQLCQYLTLVAGFTDDEAQLEILKLWEAKGKVACLAGTAMHKNIEDFLNGMLPPPETALAAPEGVADYIGMMGTFYPEMELRPWRTEFLVCLTTLASDGVEIPVVAGAIDCIMIDKFNRYWILDWKRVDPKKKGLLGKRRSDGSPFRPEKAKGPFQSHDADSFTQYSAQLLAYKWIIENGGYDLNIAGCFLVQIHPSIACAHVIEVLDLEDEVDSVMRDEIEAAKREHAEKSGKVIA